MGKKIIHSEHSVYSAMLMSLAGVEWENIVQTHKEKPA